VAGEMLGPMQFVAKPHVLSNSGTILFGGGGTGKSTTAFLIAVAVDSGTNGIWQTNRSGLPTLYINLERSPESIIRRIFAVNSALGLNPDRPLNVLNARGKSLTSLEPIIRKFVEEHGIKFLILDSISRTGIGKLTEDDTANMLINMLNSFGCAWLAIGHTSKENKDETFGSVHFGNGADITAALSSEKRGALETGVRIEVKKANDIAFPAPMTLQYTFDEEYGLHTARLAGVEEYPDLEAKPSTAGEAVYQWLLNDAGRGTATMAAKATGFQRAAITKTFERDPRFTRVEQIGAEVFYAVKHEV
jgi:KaiC/GvpD/RAD55 family RecA-like ATPase